LAGNDAASLSARAVTNNTPVPADTTAPVFSSATVNGSTLVLTYTDLNNLDAANPPAASAFTVSGHTVSGVSVNSAAKTVTLTLSTPAAYGETVTVSYTDPTAGNDGKAIQDLAGNDAASFSARPATNSTPVSGDTAAPVFSSAVVNGSTLVLTYTDANNLDAANPPSASAFRVSGHVVSGVSVNAAAKTVTLTLSTPAVFGETVTVSYTDPSAGNDAKAIQDLAGNDAAGFWAKPATNNTPSPVQGGSSDGEDDSEDDSHDFSGSSESDDDSDNHNNSSKVKSGTSGNDNLSGSGGEYIMIGGKGNDTYIVDSSGDVVTEQKNEGTDTVKSSISFILGSNVENLTLTGSNSINGTGNSLNNIIIGNTGNNIIDGGAGNDTMQGGQGNDTYIVNATGDVVNESAYQGSDTVKTSVSYTLGANVENLSLTGSASINGTGNALANSLIGNIGNNILVGGAGNDLIAGDYGNDTLTGGSGRDSFIFNTIPGFGNRDTITDFVHGTDKLQFSSSVFTGFDGLIGTPGSDQFYSAAGAVTAHDLSDRIIYNSSTGALYYDLDGAGGTDAIQVAVLGTGSHPSLSASDIQIIT
ncbi:MAG: hypothetical protein HGA70_03880, partial [Chlorobiaceae bacterium]|nr:hypothetical protein [Chlorobiaceae bacterium]